MGNCCKKKTKNNSLEQELTGSELDVESSQVGLNLLNANYDEVLYYLKLVKCIHSWN